MERGVPVRFHRGTRARRGGLALRRMADRWLDPRSLSRAREPLPMRRAAAIVAVLAMACSSSGGEGDGAESAQSTGNVPTTPTTRRPTTTNEYGNSYSGQNLEVYQLGLELCGSKSLLEVAMDLGMAGQRMTDPIEVASEYGLGYQAPYQVPAASGCLAGIRAREGGA